MSCLCAKTENENQTATNAAVAVVAGDTKQPNKPAPHAATDGMQPTANGVQMTAIGSSPSGTWQVHISGGVMPPAAGEDEMDDAVSPTRLPSSGEPLLIPSPSEPRVAGVIIAISPASPIAVQPVTPAPTPVPAPAPDPGPAPAQVAADVQPTPIVSQPAPIAITDTPLTKELGPCLFKIDGGE